MNTSPGPSVWIMTLELWTCWLQVLAVVLLAIIIWRSTAKEVKEKEEEEEEESESESEVDSEWEDMGETEIYPVTTRASRMSRRPTRGLRRRRDRSRGT